MVGFGTDLILHCLIQLFLESKTVRKRQKLLNSLSAVRRHINIVTITIRKFQITKQRNLFLEVYMWLDADMPI